MQCASSYLICNLGVTRLLLISTLVSNWTYVFCYLDIWAAWMNLNLICNSTAPVICIFMCVCVCMWGSSNTQESNENIAQISHCNLSHAEQCGPFIVSFKRTWPILLSFCLCFALEIFGFFYDYSKENDRSNNKKKLFWEYFASVFFEFNNILQCQCNL